MIFLENALNKNVIDLTRSETQYYKQRTVFSLHDIKVIISMFCSKQSSKYVDTPYILYQSLSNLKVKQKQTFYIKVEQMRNVKPFGQNIFIVDWLKSS